MKKHLYLLSLLTFVACSWCAAQNDIIPREDDIRYETIYLDNFTVPRGITRTIKQDSKGNIWLATFEGMFKYDGKSFTNMTSEVSTARFFSVLEDKKGNFWFGSIGSGVFYYDARLSEGVGQGKSFQNFTTAQGLAGDAVTHIYEDKQNNVWFATQDGASRYDGKSFRNYRMNEGNKDDNDVNTIVEDKTGKFWFGTRGKACTFDGKTFTVITHEGQPLWNIRSVIEDKKGHVWLGGEQGLWRYDGSNYTKISDNFVGYIIEDKKGNIWTSSQKVNSQGWARNWGLSRYDVKTLSDKEPAVTEIRSKYDDNKGMTFGILEANDGAIWFGALDGVYKYAGNTMTDFKTKESPR
jgi:ligand-binding sensor domain-containing protein